MASPPIEFREECGGRIIGPTGQVVARVIVEDMTTAEAVLCVAAIVAALNAAFAKGAV